MVKLSLRSAVEDGYLTVLLSLVFLVMFIAFAATDILYAAFISLVLLFSTVALGAVGISEREG